MKKQVLINEINNKVVNGQFINIAYARALKRNELAKGYKDIEIIKQTNGVFRLGITYANMQRNVGRTIEPLPWGAWEKGFENFILEHTNKNGEYNEYLRVYTNENKNLLPKTTYFMNGQEYTKEDLIQMGIINQPRFNNNGLFVINILDIITIG